MNPTEFSLAVLEQRAPEVYHMLDRAYSFESQEPISPAAVEIIDEIKKSSSLTDQRAKLICAILRSEQPVAAWAVGREQELLAQMRALRPSGMTDGEWDGLFGFVNAILAD